MKKTTLFFTSLILTAIFSIGTIAQHYTKLSDFPENVKKTKPFKRFEWFYQQRAFPYDTVPYNYANKVFYNEIKRIKKDQNQSNKLITWSPKGPAGVQSSLSYANWGFVSGRVTTIAIHPNNPGVLYIGAASGGIWKTTNGGDNWQDIGVDLESLTYGAIAIDPNNPEIVYAGAGEACSRLRSYYFGGNGLYKSTDGGLNWEQDTSNFGPYTHFSDIVVSPFNSDILFASLAFGSNKLGSNLPNEGIWKSSNAGDDWIKCLDHPGAYDVMLHPNDPNIIFACIGGSHDASGFYKSTDQGETWTAYNDGLPGSVTISRMHIDISLLDPNILYAVIYQFGSGSKAYKSQNGGENWAQISEGVNLGGYWWSSGWYDQGWYDLCIAVDPLDPDHVYIGNVELHETTDGENFSPVRMPGGTSSSDSPIHCDYHKLVYAPSNPGLMYIGTDGGVYSSSDGCATAESKNYGLETFQFYRIGSHPTDPDIILGGMEDNGSVITNDGGESWQMVTNGDGMFCFFNYQNPMIVYCSYQQGHLLRSLNGGSSFNNYGDINGAWVTPFFAHRHYPDTLYAANKKIMMRTWNTDWEPISDMVSVVFINSFVQSSVNPNNMIFAGNNEAVTTLYSTVKVSTDKGYTWTEVTDNIPGELRWVSRVVTHPIEENTMYIVRTGYSEGNKIYKTTDLGETWINVSGNLPDIPCNDLFIDPENTNHYYIATDLGVYFSENEGESWEYSGDGMPKVPVMDFDYVKIDGIRYLRVATYGRSIYETTDLVTDIKTNELSSESAILAKPNPFTTTTTFEYELQRSSIVEINLYNQLGEKVMEILNEHQTNGKHKFNIDLSDLKPGVYFCTLHSSNRTETVKVIKY